MRNRGILTEDDRSFFRGEKSVEEEDKMRAEKLFNIRERIEHLSEDIDILDEAGEDETIKLLYGSIKRYEQLERQLQDIQQQIDELE
jgi:uncharacterized protein YnzC (UPF0291/DUF896 family)